jgi:hypothetical protein
MLWRKFGKEEQNKKGVTNMAHDNINHPLHYGGSENPFEPIKIIDYYNLDFSLGNVIKYVLRAGQKNGNTMEQDLKKAKWYLEHYLEKTGKE